jgi:hypothetical protein
MRKAVLLAFVALFWNCTRSSELTTRLPAPGAGASECGRWTRTGYLGSELYRHNMVRLLDGRVLLAGGITDESTATALAQVYDPATGEWAFAAPMPAERGKAGASLLPDGRVLISGSASEPDLTSVIYDPATNAWSATGAPTGGPGQTLTALASGNVLSTGGTGASGRPLVGAEVYCPSTGTWSPVGEMEVPRSLYTATLLQDGRVLVTGGHNVDLGGALSSVEIFDPATNRWAPAACMTAPRYEHRAVLLPDGRVLVAGGRTASGEITASAELFDPISGTWSATGSMFTPRTAFEMNVIGDGRVLAAGGNILSSGFLSTPRAELFEPAAGSWKVAVSMNTTRTEAASVVLLDGRVLISGGYQYPPPGPWNCCGSASAGTEIYTPCGEGENLPPVALCKDTYASVAPGCVSDASIDDGSEDPDSGPGPLVLTLDPPPPYREGETWVTLTASDGAASSSCQAMVIVRSGLRSPPEIPAGAISPDLKLAAEAEPAATRAGTASKSRRTSHPP